MHSMAGWAEVARTPPRCVLVRNARCTAAVVSAAAEQAPLLAVALRGAADPAGIRRRVAVPRPHMRGARARPLARRTVVVRALARHHRMVAPVASSAAGPEARQAAAGSEALQAAESPAARHLRFATPAEAHQVVTGPPAPENPSAPVPVLGTSPGQDRLPDGRLVVVVVVHDDDR